MSSWSAGAPLALVLTGGGARAAYQVGVLSAIAERLPSIEFPILTGVSAGAINTTYLAAHRAPFRTAVEKLRDEWRRLTADRVYRLPLAHLALSVVGAMGRTALGRGGGSAVVRGLMDMRPLHSFLEGCIDVTGIDTKISAGRLRAVALTATSYSLGQTVTFVQGAPDVPLWRRAMRFAVRTRLTLDHIMASSAIPILFPAVRLGDGFYGDGSVRQTAPLSPAIHLGARAILAIGLQAMPPLSVSAPPSGEYPSFAEVAGLLLHSTFLDALDTDAERLEQVNQLLGPPLASRSSASPVQRVALLLLQPSRDLGTLAAGAGARLPSIVRLIVWGMGGRNVRASDLLSYLLFDPAYTSRLVELGSDDGLKQWATIEPFLARAHAPAA
jgi:NTE family protein